MQSRINFLTKNRLLASPTVTLSRPLLALLAALFLAAWLWPTGSRTLVRPDEGRYTEIAREMALSADYVTPTLNGLNFRMIQYARRAMQLVAGHGEFGVIYAPGWPAWLAALEIRNRTGRPLVLYAAALASDTAAPAERGWLLGIERMALRRARLVLVPDAGMQQLLHQRHGADLGEVRIVPAADETALQLVLAEVALG